MSVSPYVFTGISPFVERSALQRGVDVTHIGRANEVWFVKRIQEAIGSMWKRDWTSGKTVKQDRVTQLELLRQIGLHRECLASTLAGIDAAVLEVVTQLDLPIPAYLEGSIDGARHLRDSDDSSVGGGLADFKTGGLKVMIDKSVAANPAIANPTVQATAASSVATGGLAAGVYRASYTWCDAFGETTIGTGESNTFTVSGTTQLWTVTIPSLPTGAQSANVYVTKAGGAAGSGTLFGTGITATTFALSNTPPTEQPGASAPASNMTGAAAHTGRIYSIFGYGHQRDTTMIRVTEEISNMLSGYPIERRAWTGNLLSWIGIFKLWYTVMNEIGVLVAANMPTALTNTIDPRGMPKQRWTLP